MLKRMDTELKLILDLMNQAKDIKPPDFGSLADWAYEQNAKKAKQAQGPLPISYFPLSAICISVQGRSRTVQRRM